MDSEGNIYLFKNHPDPDTFVKEYNLAMISDDEFPTVVNMSQKDKKNWYNERKAVA